MWIGITNKYRTNSLNPCGIENKKALNVGAEASISLCMHIFVLLCTILYYDIYIVQGYGHVNYVLSLFPRMFTSMDFEQGSLNSDIWRIW